MNEETHTRRSFARLRRSIMRHGILAPVFVTPEGKILDGHHRVEIAEQLGVCYPVVVWPEDVMPETRQYIEKLFREMGDQLMADVDFDKKNVMHYAIRMVYTVAAALTPQRRPRRQWRKRREEDAR